MRRILLSLLLLILFVPLSSFPSEKTDKEVEKLVENLGGNCFKLGDIVIDKNANSVRFPAKVNMDEGLLELLLCAPYGKAHESLFVTDIDAIHMNLALIMIGCKSGNLRVGEQGEDVIPDGTLVTIEVAYKDGDADKEKVIRAEDWVYNDKEKKAMQHTDWVYTGSFISKEGDYMAKMTGTYIVTFHDPYTIIDIPIKEGADDTVFWVNKDAVKKKGFPVELIITVIEKKEEKGKE